jgi:hypothetical protein
MMVAFFSAVVRPKSKAKITSALSLAALGQGLVQSWERQNFIGERVGAEKTGEAEGLWVVGCVGDLVGSAVVGDDDCGDLDGFEVEGETEGLDELGDFVG